MTPRTVQRCRRRWREQGLAGLACASQMPWNASSARWSRSNSGDVARSMERPLTLPSRPISYGTPPRCGNAAHSTRA
ncbi:hypothetical protein [Corallococcus interemptor]|uniref:hypothetical protein n=1 Tax=Corallococcus interemptor TaxID=2316720 RepID=UPI0035D4B1A1